MTRQPYDQFSKQYLSVLFQTSGKIEISLQVSGEVRLIDFTFSPAPDKQDNLANLGLLGKMGVRDSLFEPFRQQPNFSQVHSCLLKLLKAKTSDSAIVGATGNQFIAQSSATRN